LDETYDVAQEWREMMDDYNVEHGGDARILMVEAYANLENTLRFYETENGKPRAHFPFNFILIENLNEGSSPHDFKNQIDQWLNQMPDGAVANWVLGNHDKPRFGSRYGKERIDSMLTLLMTLPGISVTYNGDEIGMLDHRDISWGGKFYFLNC
jgi:alpha-glucosidase